MSRLRTLLRFITDVLHPARSPGGRWPSIALIAVLVLTYVLGAGSGWIGRGHFDREAYFAHRYGAQLATTGAFFSRMKPNYHVQMPKVARVASTGRITTAIYPAVGDQYDIGSCAAWAAAWDASYEYRLAHPGSMLRFSPRWLYDWYTRGAGDTGSDVETNLSVFPTMGVPRFKQFPFPPYLIDWPVPATDASGGTLAADAAKYRMADTVTNGGLGATALAYIRAEVTLKHPVMIAFAVYSSYMSSTGYVPAPGPGETYYGGHENVVIAYDDNRVNPDGTSGAVLIQNQWNTNWGNKGRAWMSYTAFTGPNAILYEVKGLRLG